ncbi:WD repeat-containing protein C4F8.11 [Seiridium cupressi]
MYNQGKIMRRLLGRPTNDSTATDNNLGPSGSPIAPSYRPNASQDAQYPAVGPIACLDKSPDGQFAVLGGRHVLKTVQIDGLTIKEGIDVRAIITSQPNTKPGASTTVSDQLSIKDVKWATNQNGESTIFTACANGRIFQYNLSRLSTQTAGGAGLEFVQMREDSRQINTLDINPHRSSWLLSGSQDGIVRCFDTKSPVVNRNAQATYRAFQSFKCNAEGIRDVQWSPKDGMVFACATESGAVFKWDIRKPTAPLLRINAHDPTRGASCVAWHFDGDRLLSAGLDSVCHVWDMSDGANKRQKPMWSISTPAPIACVSWRPPLYSATAKGRRAAQIAVSYVDGPTKGYGISPVHIWDFGRPTMPFKEIDRFDFSPNALIWHDQDLLWTAGSNGFSQCDVAYAPKVVDRKSPSALVFAPRGEVLMVLEERSQSRRPHPTIATHDMIPASFSSSPNTQVLSHSRSDSEEDVVGSFLGPSKPGSKKPTANSRSAHTLSTTPPSGSTSDEPIIPLEQSIGVTKIFKPNQVMAMGQATAPSKAKHYQFLSRHYLDALLLDLPYTTGGAALNVRVCDIMEHYARAAESIGQIRLAQTWRILAQAFGQLLDSRGRYHLDLRLAKRKNAKSPLLREKSASKLNLQKLAQVAEHQAGGEETPRKASYIHSTDSRSSLGQSLLPADADSESNVPTPVARPIREDLPAYHQFIPGKVLTPVQELDSLILPPAFHKEVDRPGLRERHDSAPLSVISQGSQLSSTEGYDFYDMEAVEAIPQAIDVPKKKEPLSLDYMDLGTSGSRRPEPARHDSDESFGQMFSVSDGSRLTAEAGSLSSSLRGIVNRSEAIIGSNKSSTEEYHSRIRGKQIHRSSEASHAAGPRGLDRQDSDSSRDIFMISQTTADSGESQPSRGDSFELSQPSGGFSPAQLRVKQPQPPRKSSNERLISGRPEQSTSPNMTEADFMPWNDDPPYPFPLSSDAVDKLRAPLLKPYELLSRVLAYEAQSSALNASAMILLLKPLVPDDVIDPDLASAILRHHHDRLMKQKFFIEAATLRNLCVADWPEGVEVWGDNYTSIFFPAQDPQRVSANFTCPSCHKPREINRSDGGLGVWKCEKCRYTMGPCAVCKHRDATVVSHPPMPLIKGIAHWQESRDEVVLSTWWYCPGCKHGGHAACLEGWHSPMPPDDCGGDGSTPGTPGLPPEAFSEGCCPMDGCGHACLPGRWREALSNAKKEPLERNVREHTRNTIPSLHRNDHKTNPLGELVASAPAVIGGVRSDALVVSQSRAVEGVREVLAASDAGNGSSTEDGSRLSRAAGGILSVLSSSPGRSSSQTPAGVGVQGIRFNDRGERERRKSVKFAAGATDERR